MVENSSCRHQCAFWHHAKHPATLSRAASDLLVSNASPPIHDSRAPISTPLARRASHSNGMLWQPSLPLRPGDKEFRELSRDEEDLLRTADSTAGGAPVSDFPPALVHALYRRNLIYIDVPVAPSQRFSTSSLEGFVSNRDLVVGDGDPMEALLYEVGVLSTSAARCRLFCQLFRSS
jgi:hypothetical protein